MDKTPTRRSNNYMGLVIMAVLFFLFFSPILKNNFSTGEREYTKEEFRKDLQSGSVEAVEIAPNKDNATGYAVVKLGDKKSEYLYATVISDIEEMAREAGVYTTVRDIPSENLFMTSILVRPEYGRKQCPDDEFRQEQGQAVDG